MFHKYVSYVFKYLENGMAIINTISNTNLLHVRQCTVNYVQYIKYKT